MKQRRYAIWCVQIACGRNRRTCKLANQKDVATEFAGYDEDGAPVERDVYAYFPSPYCPFSRKAPSPSQQQKESRNV